MYRATDMNIGNNPNMMNRATDMNIGNNPNMMTALSADNINYTLTENNKHLAKAFESQCKEDFDEAFE